MRRLGEAFYGRVKNYHAALSALPATEDLSAMVKRTVFAGVEAPALEVFMDYILRQRDGLREQATGDLALGNVSWISP
ncbi:MAG: hypothetical protein CGW95_04665 [Phenylobacterium zucineum]|nr:MAG: hypothetical protein CGW95_04665 [Phenylobacterium zucineum]